MACILRCSLRASPCHAAVLAFACMAAAAHSEHKQTRTVESIHALAGLPVQAAQTLPAGGGDAFRSRVQPRFIAPASTVRSAEEVEATRRPARLAISSPFGWRADPIEGIKRRHDGVDLPGTTGTRIYATGAGVVRTAGWIRGYGNLVEIRHVGRITTRYGHLSRIYVTSGANVAQGELIGAMGSTGHSTGPHLHYEVRLDGAPVDPLGYMGQAAPRYRIDWSMQGAATPRWVGWSNIEKVDRLPSAQIH